MRVVLRVVAVVGGALSALWFSHIDHWAWYGQSHGDDALSLGVWIVSTYILVRGADSITR